MTARRSRAAPGPWVRGLLAAGPALLVLVVAHAWTAAPGFLEALQDGSSYLPVDVVGAGIATFGPAAKGLVYVGIGVGVLVAGALAGLAASRAAGGATSTRGALVLALALFVLAEGPVLWVFHAGLLGADLAFAPLPLHLPLAVACLMYAAVFAALARAERDGALGPVPEPSSATAAPPTMPANVAPAPRWSAADEPTAPLATDVSARLATDLPARLGGLPPSSAQVLAGSPPSRPAHAASGPTGVPSPSRRRFLVGSLQVAAALSALGALGAMAAQTLAVAGLGQAGGGGAGSSGTGGAGTAAAGTAGWPAGYGPTPALTPVGDFYVVAKDLITPDVAESSWRLAITGLVAHPTELDLTAIRALPALEAYRTLECISTQITQGDHLIGNQRWTGVRLADLIDRASPTSAASWVLWRAADGYTESIPLAVARHPDTWLAYRMDGQPLPRDHGFPARILIAGRFGMKQPKWVTGLELADHDELGFWELRGWDETALELTMSRLDAPVDGARVPLGRAFAAAGIAFAGDRGISRVEVSPDGGGSWTVAELEPLAGAPLGPLSWRPWRAQLTVTRPGTTQLVVRAVDGTGAMQDGTPRDALPSGSTGWHSIRVVAGG